MNFGGTSVAAPKAASSSTARYSSTARLAASGGKPLAPSMPFSTARVRFDQAAVHGKTLATNKAFFNTTAKHSLEETPKKIALTEAAMPVL